MQKKALIITGVIIILLLISIWIYLLFFGTPKTINEVFTDFSANSGEVVNTENQNQTETSTIDVTQSKLRQLTTKPVAGFNEVYSTTTNIKAVYYAEMGTGHIYSINLETGEEKRLSATTVAGVSSAEISAKGDYVALGSQANDKNSTIIIGKISSDTNEIITKELSNVVDDFSISLSGTDLFYTNKDTNGLSGHSYNFKSGNDKILFTTPFHEATIQWGRESDDTHYLYPKPTYLLEGYLYQVSKGKMSRLPISGHGLTAMANDHIVAYSIGENGLSKNYVYNRQTKTTKTLNTTILPEKCIIAVSTEKLICAWEAGVNLPVEFPDKWYQGTTQYKDSIWDIYGDTPSINLIVDTFEESNRNIDITNLKAGVGNKNLYFINKNDNTLWMYEL